MQCKRLARYSGGSTAYVHTVGLISDGTVTAMGLNKHDQCNVCDWRDIVAIAGGSNHTIGLKSDGTVAAVGWNEYGQCDVCDWHDIVAVAAGCAHLLALNLTVRWLLWVIMNMANAM